MPLSEYLAGSPPVLDQLQNGDGNWHRHLRFELLDKCASFAFKKGSSSSPVWNVLFTARLSRLASTIHCSRFRRLERSKRFERSRRSKRSEMWTERNRASTHGFRLASLIGLPSMDCVHRRFWTSNTVDFHWKFATRRLRIEVQMRIVYLSKRHWPHQSSPV